MHRPQSTAESTPPAQIWLQTHGRKALVLAVSYFLFGHASFLVQVDDVLVTPVLFAPEGIALAMALRFGAGVWPGIFVGQLALALSRGLDPIPAASISTINSIEAVLAVLLFRACKLDASLLRARDLTGLLLVIFFVLQPFSASLGNATLWASGIVDRADLPTSWINWWIGNSLGQMLIAPLLLALFAGQRTRWQAIGDFLVPLAVILPAFWVGDQLLHWAGAPSLVVLFAPILVLFAVYRGMVSVCMAALLISLGALYATSHAFGPFVSQGRADIPGLNLFIIGLALSGQFLAVFLRQARLQQKLADELRDAREQLQRTAYELTENIPVGTYVLEFDADGKPHFTFLSERFLAMTGLRREELMANHALALQPMNASDRAEIERLNREVFAAKKPFFWEGEITVRGEKRHVTLESTPRSRPAGGTIWEGVMTDITERRNSERQLRLVLDNLPVAVAQDTLESPAKITFLNEHFTRIFGYTRDDVPTVQAWAEQAYPDPAYRREVFREWDEAVSRAIESKGRVESMEFEVVCKDGSRRNVVFNAAALTDSLLVTMTDVTERRKAEAALRSLREQVERTAFELTENIPVGTYTMVQPPGGGAAYFSFMSTRFLELTGLDREAARENPMNAFACVHPDDHAEWVRKNTYVFEHRLPFSEECRIVVGGQTRWIHAESSPRDLPDGSVVWEGVLTDITDRKLSEQQLAEAGRSMRLAASAAQLGFWEYDIATGLDRWDDECARIHGVNPGSFDGRWEKFLHPEDREKVLAETRRMIESEDRFEMEYRIVRPDGAVRFVQEHGMVSRDNAGRPLRASGVTQDVTAKKEAADNLIQAAQSMKLAAAAAGMGFWSREIASRHEEWDEQMFFIYGVDRDRFDGTWERHIHPDDVDRVLLETEAAIKSARNSVYEFRVVRADGTIRHVRGLSTIVRDSKGHPVREIGVDFDITEEKEASEREKQREEAHRRELESKLKTSLAAAAVAHEINQPLSAILLRANMALGDDSDASQALSDVAGEAQRVVTTIEKMKTLMRSVQTEHYAIDLSAVVRSALLYNKTMLSRQAITMRESGLDQAQMIMGDDAQLQLALTNILRNAAEAIDESAAKRREISIDLSGNKDDVILTIGDSGPGWSGAELAETPLTTTKKGGTGIGLYVARTATENHRGKITFGKSALGGAEVKLTFPRVER